MEVRGCIVLKTTGRDFPTRDLSDGRDILLQQSHPPGEDLSCCGQLIEIDTAGGV
jgi:hypothetical protein